MNDTEKVVEQIRALVDYCIRESTLINPYEIKDILAPPKLLGCEVEMNND